MDAQQKHSSSACTWRLPAVCGHAQRCSEVVPLGTPSISKYSAARPHAAKHLSSAGTRACIYGICCFQHCLDPLGLAFSPEAHIPISLRPHTQSQPSCTFIGTSQPTSKVSLLTIAALKLPPPPSVIAVSTSCTGCCLSPRPLSLQTSHFHTGTCTSSMHTAKPTQYSHTPVGAPLLPEHKKAGEENTGTCAWNEIGPGQPIPSHPIPPHALPKLVVTAQLLAGLLQGRAPPQHPLLAPAML